jgi:hypothetical protein
MDFYERGDLWNIIAQQQQPFDEPVLHGWIMSALRGLEAIHSRGVVN